MLHHLKNLGDGVILTDTSAVVFSDGANEINENGGWGINCYDAVSEKQIRDLDFRSAGTVKVKLAAFPLNNCASYFLKKIAEPMAPLFCSNP